MASVSNPFTFYPDPLTYTELFNWCCGNFDKEHVMVELSHKFNRKPASKYFEETIEKIWETRLTEVPSLYNGSKFRLKEVMMDKECLRLYIGLSCYKDFICTNMNREDSDHLREWGRGNYGDPHSCFGDPIGVNGLVVSSDGWFVFIRRSKQVYEAQGKLHTPGGHPEPNEIINKGESPRCDDMDPSMVVHEMFYSIVKEVRDEVNIPEDSLSWPVLIGILRNQTSSGRPEMCFAIRCSLSRQEIKTYYDKGGPEAYESTEIVFLNVKEFEEWNPSDDVAGICDQLTASAKATIHFYINRLHCQHVKTTYSTL